MNGVIKTVIFTEADFYKLDSAFRHKANFEEIDSSWYVPQDIEQEIIHGHPRVQTHLASGVSRLETQNYRAYQNGDDVVQMADFKLVTNHQVYDDPVIVIRTANPDSQTVRIVKDLLTNELKVCVIESTMKNGMQHQNTRTLFEELAGVTNQSFDNLFNGTFDDLMVSMRESLDRQTERVQQLIQQQTMRERY